jgi:hypothetical protein
MPLIPPDQLTTSTPGVFCGVIGGIPTDRNTLIDVTQAPYNADNTGTSDASSAIQAAIDAAASGEVVYLPTGTYRIDSTLVMSTTFSGKSFRGDGMDLTIIDARCSEVIRVGSFSGYTTYDPPVLVTSGLSKDSQSVDVSEATTDFTVGDLVLFLIENDASLPVASVYNYDVWTNESPMRQLVKLVSKDADTLNFFPPLYDGYGEGALTVRVIRQTFKAQGIGIEELTIDCTNYNGGGGTTGSFAGLQMKQCSGSWVLNVRSKKAYNYGMFLADCLNCEVRGCYSGNLKGSGSNGAAYLLNTWACLYEDNIAVQAFPLIEVSVGSAGNVFSYNYGGVDGAWNTNHAPHNNFNIHEGNAVAYQISDGYFGSEGNLTLFRNFFYQISVNLRRFTRNCAAVGNILSGQIGVGLPFISNTSFSGTAQLSLGDPWRDWEMTGELTTRTDDNAGVITLNSGELFGGSAQVIRLVWGTNLENQRFALVSSVAGNQATIANYVGGTPLPAQGTTVSIGPGSYYSGVAATSSYCEMDLDVEATLTKKGNYYVDSNTSDSLDGDTLPDSLIYASEPDWWPVGMAWPPFDPANIDTANVLQVPAAVRYFASEPEAAPEITTPCTVTGTPIQGQTLTAVAGTVTGNPPPTRTWKWQRGGVDIVGATSITYLLTGADVGFDVGPVQIETNTEGFDESVATPLTILAFMGDILTVTQVANAAPVTELWKRGALTSGVAAAPSHYLVQHSGPYPTQPDNNFVYQRFGTPQDHVYVFEGTISEAEAIASVP